VHRDRIDRIATEHLNDVAGLKIALAQIPEDGIGRQPPRGLVVDEWIVVGFDISWL
jgi:hypothetical protein